jgi:hypothetical protein
MKSRSRVVLAAAIAMLFLLNASGLCGAAVTQPSQRAHPCCPTHSTSRGDTSRPCCLATSAPVPSVVTGAPSIQVWIASPITASAVIRLRSAELTDVSQSLSPSRQLYLNFHQLLI